MRTFSGIRRIGPAVGAVMVLAFASGCAADADEGPRQAADGFEAAVSDGDGPAACALLTDAAVDELESSSGEPCEKAILDEVESAGDRVEVTRFGTMAQVRFRGDVLFMAQAPEGWRVMAAACQATPGGKPYDCGIAGG
jgi:hypothetical protein